MLSTFRKKRSCETQLILTVEGLAGEIDKGGQIDVILLDFLKAFDKIPHKWENGFLLHQRQDKEMDSGLPLQQNTAGGSQRRTLLHRLNHLRCTSRLHPRPSPLLDLYQ